MVLMGRLFRPVAGVGVTDTLAKQAEAVLGQDRMGRLKRPVASVFAAYVDTHTARVSSARARPPGEGRFRTHSLVPQVKVTKVF